MNNESIKQSWGLLKKKTLWFQPFSFFFFHQIFRKYWNMKEKPKLFLPNSSSNVNEVARAILSFFYFIYEKILHAQKGQSAYKRTKIKKAAFLCA